MKYLTDYELENSLKMIKQYLKHKKLKKDDPQYVSTAHHFFPFHETCRKHKEMLYQNEITQKLIIYSYNIVHSSISENARTKCLLMVKCAAKYADNNGLIRTLPTAINLVYAINVNIKPDDGLINGAICILKKIQYLEQSTKQMPSILWLYFEDMKIGQQWRYRYERFYNLEIDKTWTPISAIDHHFAVLNGKVT